MTSAEDRLTAALEATANTVRDDTLRPLVVADGRPRRWRPVLAPIAAAAAVLLVIVGVDLATGGMTGAASGGTPVAPIAEIAGFPTGIAVDGANGTVYVSSGDANVLSVVNAATCNASSTGGCAHAGQARTAGQDPIGVAVDEQTQTVYAVNGGSNTVAVINAATCNAATISGCSKKPALVHVPGGPEFLAVNPLTDTIYVADTSSGQVSVINGKTCNASDTSGCAQAPATVRVGAGAFPIEVDATTDTVYVGTNSDLVVIDGRTCNGADVSGCAKVLATVPVGSDPAGIAVDQAAGTVYVSSEGPDTVTLINRNTCSALDATGCPGQHRTIGVGSDPRGVAVDGATHTVYVTNAASDTVSMINAATCNATSVSGCERSPRAFPVGASPRRITVDTATDTVYVVNVIGGTLSVINGGTCNAVDAHGCPTKSSAKSTGPGGRAGPGGDTSSCSPAVVGSESGQPAGPLTASSVRVASGSVGSQAWSLWAKKRVTGANGLEDGGLVLGGRWYGLCPGFPNVAEMELVNAGARGVDYGFVQYPGKVTVGLTSAGRLPAPSVIRVDGMTFFIGQLPRSACSYPQLVLNASEGSAASAIHHLTFGTCGADKVVNITGSEGEWGSGSMGSGTSSLMSSGGGGVLANRQDNCSQQATTVSSGKPAGPLTTSAVQVASGSVGGQAWGLWAKKGSAGVTSIENGGLVFGGRWYGLCPGPPNPAEFELLNAGAHGIAYGFVANPGDYAVTMKPGDALSAPQIRRVADGTFFIGQLAKSACAYPSLVLYATTRSVTDMHQLSFSGCGPNQLVTISGGHGSW